VPYIKGYLKPISASALYSFHHLGEKETSSFSSIATPGFLRMVVSLIIVAIITEDLYLSFRDY
jgi:hypothetical protein